MLGTLYCPNRAVRNWCDLSFAGGSGKCKTNTAVGKKWDANREGREYA